jgi:hypothetical protein
LGDEGDESVNALVGHGVVMGTPRQRRFPVEPLAALAARHRRHHPLIDGLWTHSGPAVETHDPEGRYGKLTRYLFRWRHEGAIPEWSADRWAIHYGLHPCRLWPDWFDGPDLYDDDA